MALADDFGRRVRACRHDNRMTVRQLAKKVGVSAGYVSQIENGRSSPSLATSLRFARELQVPIGYLVSEGLDPVVRANERRKVLYPESSLVYELICPNMHCSMEAWVARLQPGRCSSEKLLRHDVEELVLVLEGRMEVFLDVRSYILHPGDSLYYHGLTPHKFCSVGEEELAFVSVETPPKVQDGSV